MPFANINKVRTYYETHGDGDTLVFLHNGFSCSKVWEDIYPSFVEKGYRVVMYDRRGFGESEKGVDFENFYAGDRYCSESVEELAILCDMLNIDSFHIIGQCEGGVVGVEYAIKYPQQIHSLVVSSTQCYSELNMPEYTKLKFPKPVQDLDPGFKKKLIHWHGEEHAESFYKMFRNGGGAYGTGIFDFRNLLPSLECPTLVLFPDRSFIFDVEQAVAFYHHLPNGELAVLPNCGHNAFEDQPEEYIRSILSFLRRHDF